MRSFVNMESSVHPRYNYPDVYTQTYVNTTHIRMYVYVYMCIRMYICVVHTCTVFVCVYYVHTYMYVFVHVLCVYVCMCIYTYIRVCKDIALTIRLLYSYGTDAVLVQLLDIF